MSHQRIGSRNASPVEYPSPPRRSESGSGPPSYAGGGGGGGGGALAAAHAAPPRFFPKEGTVRYSPAGLKYYDLTRPVPDPAVAGEGEVTGDDAYASSDYATPVARGYAPPPSRGGFGREPRRAHAGADTASGFTGDPDVSYNPSSLPTYFALDDVSAVAPDDTLSLATTGASPARLRHQDPFTRPPLLSLPAEDDESSSIGAYDAYYNDDGGRPADGDAARDVPIPILRIEDPEGGEDNVADNRTDPQGALDIGHDLADGGAGDLQRPVIGGGWPPAPDGFAAIPDDACAVEPPKIPDTLWVVLHREVPRGAPASRAQRYLDVDTKREARGGAEPVADAAAATPGREDAAAATAEADADAEAAGIGGEGEAVAPAAAEANADGDPPPPAAAAFGGDDPRASRAPTTTRREVHCLKLQPDFVNNEPAWQKHGTAPGPRVVAGDDGEWQVLDTDGSTVVWASVGGGTVAEGWLPHQKDVVWAAPGRDGLDGKAGEEEGVTPAPAPAPHVGVQHCEIRTEIPNMMNPRRPANVSLHLCSHKRDTAVPAVALAREQRRQLAMQREALHQQIARDAVHAEKIRTDLRNMTREPPVQRGVNAAVRDAYHREVLCGGAPTTTRPTGAEQNPAAGNRPWEHYPTFVPAAEQKDVAAMMTLPSEASRSYVMHLPQKYDARQRKFEKDYVKQHFAAARDPAITPIPAAERGISQQIAHLRAQCYGGGQPRTSPLVAPPRPDGKGGKVRTGLYEMPNSAAAAAVDPLADAHPDPLAMGRMRYTTTPLRAVRPPLAGGTPTPQPVGGGGTASVSRSTKSAGSLGSRWLQTPAVGAGGLRGGGGASPADLGSVARQL